MNVIGFKATLSIALSLIFTLLATGCATVKPAGDYEKAGDLITEVVGSAQVYNPLEEALIEETIATLLAGGVECDEAVGIALLNNLDFQSQFLDIGIARADVVQSGLLTNPTLFLNALIPQGGGRTKLTYGVAQEILELWRLPAQKRAAEQRLDGTVLRIAQLGAETAAKVRVAYYTALAAEVDAHKIQESETLAHDAVALVERRFDAGDVSELDVNRARALLFSVQTNAIVAARTRDTSRGALEHLLGLTFWSDPWELNGDLTIPFNAFDEATLIADALEDHPALQIARSTAMAADEELVTQQRKVIPNFNLGVSAERTVQRALPSRVEQGAASWKPSNGFDGAYDLTQGGQTPYQQFRTIRGALPDIPTQRSRELAKDQRIDFLWGPSLQMTLPLWDQNTAQVFIARAKSEQAWKSYEAMRESIVQSIQQRIIALRSGEELARFYTDRAFPIARENLEGAKRIYSAGEEGVQSIIDAQRALTELEQNFVAIQRDYAIARADLELAIGKKLKPISTTPEANNDGK